MDPSLFISHDCSRGSSVVAQWLESASSDPLASSLTVRCSHRETTLL